MAIGCGRGDFRPCRVLGAMPTVSLCPRSGRRPRSRPPWLSLPAPGRRAGYLVAIVVNAALLFILNGQPGWQALPFLTSATSQVLGLVNLSLAVGLAVSQMRGWCPSLRVLVAC